MVVVAATSTTATTEVRFVFSSYFLEMKTISSKANNSQTSKHTVPAPLPSLQLPSPRTKAPSRSSPTPAIPARPASDVVLSSPAAAASEVRAKIPGAVVVKPSSARADVDSSAEATTAAAGTMPVLARAASAGRTTTSRSATGMRRWRCGRTGRCWKKSTLSD